LDPWDIRICPENAKACITLVQTQQTLTHVKTRTLQPSSDLADFPRG